MSVFFLYPAFLIGLAAASLPILIHLLNRRRLQRIQFPAVRFILLSQKRISRSYRLRHWLLLALRTLAVVLLVLLLANPIFQTGAGLFAGGGPVAAVLLLARTSLSNMDVPTRQALVMRVVEPSERTSAAAVTNAARYSVRPLGPLIGGLLQQVALGLPLLVAGVVKGGYDLALWRWSRRLPAGQRL